MPRQAQHYKRAGLAYGTETYHMRTSPKIPHLADIVQKYDNEEGPDDTRPWQHLVDYFLAKDNNHHDKLATLSAAGIANSATISKEDNDDMHYQLANIAAKNTALEECMQVMVASQIALANQSSGSNPTDIAAIVRQVQGAQTTNAAGDSTGTQGGTTVPCPPCKQVAKCNKYCWC